ncbi:MAG: hypothetical protein WCY58_05005 [Mariniphaga sp.]|nr:hypothetical protein [Mariniphaga sp.]MDD4226922.1 hypothetical protein [Mariniphaga sp.]
MKLEELKKTWEQLSPEKEWNEEQISELLRTRTGSLIDHIERNVRLGFVFLFVLVILFVLDDFVYTPSFIRNLDAEIQFPLWMEWLNLFSNVFIVITFIFFVVKYYRVKKSCDITCNLRGTLIKIIGTLRIYQKLFYLALFIFSISIAISFIFGMYTGMTIGVESQGIPFSDVTPGGWIIACSIGLIVLSIIVGGIFLLLRWGFRKLYGNYLTRLTQTLSELDETIMTNHTPNE